MESLAVKYRPRTFDDLVGQKTVQVILRQMVERNAVPPALLFDGMRGTGKTTSMRILAAALNCEGAPVPCGHCVSCKSVFTASSMDLTEIDAASNGLVDDIRQLRQQALYSTGGTWHVIALDEAHSMSTAAFNALLKMIEEPPPHTVFVLLTTEPGRIPDTVVSRCMPFTFRRISVAGIVSRLQHICAAEKLPVEPALLPLIAERADGGMRDAIMLLDQLARADKLTVAEYTELIGETDYAPALLKAIATGDVAATFDGLDEQMTRTGDPGSVSTALAAVLKDLWVLHAGGDLHHQGAALAARQQLADLLPAHLVFAAMRVLWELAIKVRGGDPRANLNLAVAMLTEVFGKQPKPAEAAPARKLTLAEMAKFR